jgi:hypothetical protein
METLQKTAAAGNQGDKLYWRGLFHHYRWHG